MTTHADYPAPDSATTPWRRPQSIVLTFCAMYLMPRQSAVYTGSLVETLAGVGVGEYAARSTLSRMQRRGLLERHRLGKRVYLGLTGYGERVLTEGARRLETAGAVNREWDGRWTLLGFSLPETRRADRHLLRSRLSWAGFGPLQNGLWISANDVDVDELLSDLNVVEHIKAFRASMVAPTDVDAVINGAWDLGALAASYRSFLRRWDTPAPMPDVPDELARQLLLRTEWLLLVRNDPHLPVRHLPEDWPAVRAEQVERRLSAVLREPARRIVETGIDMVALGPRPDPGAARPVLADAGASATQT